MKKTAFAAVTLASAAILSGCGSGEAPSNQTSPNDPQIEQHFNQIREHWKADGYGDVGRIANTAFVTIRTEDDVFTCDTLNDLGKRISVTHQKYTDNPVAQFCTEENTTILFEDDFEKEASGKPLSAYKIFVVAHELGHAEGDARETQAALHDDEARADCYAGAAMAALAPNEIPPLLKYFNEESNGIPGHGSGQQIATAIETGSKDPTGNVCDDYRF